LFYHEISCNRERIVCGLQKSELIVLGIATDSKDEEGDNNIAGGDEEDGGQPAVTTTKECVGASSEIDFKLCLERRCSAYFRC
jgi:hypothetical protein